MNIMQTSSSYSQDNTQNRLSVNVMQPPASLALATAQFHFHPPVYHQQLHQHNQSFPIVGAHSSNSALLPLSPSIFSSSMSSSLSSSAAVSAAVDSVSYPTAYSFLLNSSQQTMPMIGEADGELPLPSFLEMFGPMLAAAEASSSKSSRAHITAKHNSSHQYSRPLSMAPPQQHQQQHDSVLAEAANSKKRKKSEDGLSASGPSLSHLSLLLEAHDSTSASNNTDSLSLSDRDRDRAMLTVSNSSTAGAGRLGGSQQLQGPTVGAGSGFGAVSVSHDMEDDEPDPSYDYAMSGGLGLGSDESTGRWTAEEHKLFLEGIMLYGKDWKKMLPLIKTRTLVQIRTHAQKVFKKIASKGQGEGDNGEASAEVVERRPTLSAGIES